MKNLIVALLFIVLLSCDKKDDPDPQIAIYQEMIQGDWIPTEYMCELQMVPDSPFDGVGVRYRFEGDKVFSSSGYCTGTAPSWSTYDYRFSISVWNGYYILDVRNPGQFIIFELTDSTLVLNPTGEQYQPKIGLSLIKQ